MSGFEPFLCFFLLYFRPFFWVGDSDANGKATLPKKTLNFKYTRHKISVPLAMSTNLLKKSPNLKNNRKKKILGRCWAKIGLSKTHRDVNSKGRDAESSTDIDRQNQRLRHKISPRRALQVLRPTLWSQCSQNGR